MATETEELTERMRELNEALPKLVLTMERLAESVDKSAAATDKEKEKAKTDLTAEERAKAMEKTARENAVKSLTSLVGAAGSFKDALLSTEEGLKKYGDTLDNLGDSAIDLGKNFGLAGLAIGLTVKAFTSLTSASLKQTDAALKARDEIYKMGGVGAGTAEQVLDMGHKIGLTSKNLDLLTKPLSNIGSSLVALGGTVGEGTKKFAEIANVGRETRMQYSRLGISQGELIEMQTKYIKLQEQSGGALRMQGKDAATLRKESLAYVDNLVRLSALTGKSADELQKDQEIAQEEFEEMAKTRQENAKIAELRAAGRKDEADKLQSEQEARKQFINRAYQEFGRETGAQVARMARTGAIDAFSAPAAQLGFEAGKLKKDLSDLKPGEATDKYFDKQYDKAQENISKRTTQLGDALQFGGEELGKQMGLNSELYKNMNRTQGKSEEERRKLADAEIAKAKGDQDKAANARAQMKEIEISAQQALDNLIQSFNPLFKNFGIATLAVGAFSIALTAATLALKTLGKGGVTDVLTGGGGLGGGKPGLGDAVKGSFKNLGTLGKVASIGSGALAAAGGVMTAYEGYDAGKEKIAQAEADLKAGNISEEDAAAIKKEGTEEQEGAMAKGTGEAIGGVAGAAIGTAIAGPIGAMIGAQLGSTVGGTVGTFFEEWGDKREAAEEEEKKAREDMINDEKTTNEQIAELRKKGEAERAEQLQKELNERKAKFDEEYTSLFDKTKNWFGSIFGGSEEKAVEAKPKEDQSTEKQVVKGVEKLAELTMPAVGLAKKAFEFFADKAAPEANAAPVAAAPVAAAPVASMPASRVFDGEISGAQGTAAGRMEAARARHKARMDSLGFDGGRKDGGPIEQGKFAVVGEEGPEFVTGPANVLTAEQIRKAVEMGGLPYGLKLDDDGMAYASNSPFAKVMLAYETKARNDKAFQKRIQDALKGSASGNLSPYETLAFALETVEGQRWAAENDFGIDISESMDKGPNKEIRSYFNQILKQMDKEAFAGMFANGGIIPKGKFGMVGEQGPELVSGPAQITNQKQLLDQLMPKVSSLGNEKFEESTEEFINTFYETDKSVKDFDQELTGFVKADPAGKMTKQLNLVTTALEDLNEIINSNVPGGLELPESGSQKFPSPSKIANAVMNQLLSGVMGGGSMPSGGGGGGGSAPSAVPAGSGDMPPEPKGKSKGILGAIASALGIGSDAPTTESGGKDSGDAIPTPSGSVDMLDTTKTAKTAQATSVGNMSEEDIKKMIIRHEGVRYKPYKDSLGLWTVGIGHLIGDGRTLPPAWNREFSKEEVLGLFEKDYQHHRQAAEKIPGFEKMNTVGQGALTDLTFNMGPAWINKWPNTKKKLAQGDMQGAAENLEDSKWYTQVGNRAPTIVNMVRQGIKAAEGGIAEGPESGYPATLHGKEAIVPLDSNSILEALATKPASEIAEKPISAPMSEKTEEGMNNIVAINEKLLDVLSGKLDDMIDKLDKSNSIQDRLLKHSMV